MENNNEKRIKLTWNKKVVSISFLALALFMLLAVSYAYFTASVVGNEDAKDITVEAARMSLELSGPTEVKLENALPGTEVKAEFTVTNTGTVQTTYNLDMIDVENTFVDKGDLVYSVTSTNDGGHAENVVVPETNQTLIRNILIQPGEDNKQEYTLTVRFRETGVDQNSNQGKRFTGRIQINNLADNSLAAAILRVNPIQSSDDIDLYKTSPYCSNYDFQMGHFNCLEEYVKNGEGLFSTPDNDGISYYFRGAVENNNVQFAQKNWKILRINGDGSIRLIYNNEDGPGRSRYVTSVNDYTDVGYRRYNAHDCTKSNPCESNYDVDNEDFKYNYKNDETVDSPIKESLETWYKTKLASYDNRIDLATYCNDTSVIDVTSKWYTYSGAHAYGSNFNRSNRIILTCPNPTNYGNEETHNYGGVYKLKIGLITASEATLAGGNVYFNDGSIGFLSDIVGSDIGTMTPNSSGDGGGYVIWMNPSTPFYYRQTEPSANDSLDVVPVINLKADVTFSGTGTEDDPYTIN